MKSVIKGFVFGVCISVAGTSIFDEPAKFILLTLALLFVTDDYCLGLFGVKK